MSQFPILILTETPMNKKRGSLEYYRSSLLLKGMKVTSWHPAICSKVRNLEQGANETPSAFLETLKE